MCSTMKLLFLRVLAGTLISEIFAVANSVAVGAALVGVASKVAIEQASWASDPEDLEASDPEALEASDPEALEASGAEACEASGAEA